MTGQWISYFGYGSLVNRDTRPVEEVAVDVHLRGWRRAWSHRIADSHDRLIGCTSLTIEPGINGNDPSTGGIDGVLVRLRIEQLPALDQRERGYERVKLSASDFDLPTGYDCDDIIMYRSLPRNRQLADTGFPILQSYIDCVMAGYRRRFGDSGLQQMVQSTRGWERPILNDRSNPVYPRHVMLNDTQWAHHDSLISNWRGTCAP